MSLRLAGRPMPRKRLKLRVVNGPMALIEKWPIRIKE